MVTLPYQVKKIQLLSYNSVTTMLRGTIKVINRFLQRNNFRSFYRFRLYLNDRFTSLASMSTYREVLLSLERRGALLAFF